MTVDWPKLDHDRLWRAIDALASGAGLTPSALARRAGLDPTSLNKSKRVTADGRPRWPSTESLSKILAATGATLDDLSRLVDGAGLPPPGMAVVLATAPGTLGFREGGDGAEAGMSGDEVETVRLRDSCLLPLYRPGDVLVLGPRVAPRAGDRVLLCLTNRPPRVAIFWSRDDEAVVWGEAPGGEPRHLSVVAEIDRVVRILWASQ
jgi:phage repressor protein C with HTH and peptisase S24 domain